MTEQDKEKSRGIFEQMLNYCCCQVAPCNSCVHKSVCKYEDKKREKCENYRAEISYTVHGNIDALFQPIFKWIQHHYPSGGVSFYVENDTAKMKIDHGPYVFDDKYKNCSLNGFNSSSPKSEEKEDKD